MNGTAVTAGKLALGAPKKTTKKVNRIGVKGSTKAKTSQKVFLLSRYRSAIIKAAGSLLVLGILFGGLWGYLKAYEGKIYPKIIVAGVNVGGFNPQEANKAVQLQTQELNDQGPTITYNDQTLQPKLDEMGITFNIDEVIGQAYQYGRQGNLKQKLQETYQILRHRHQIEISPKIDQEKFDNYLGQLANVVEKEPVNASLSITNGTVNTSPSEKGQGLDKEKLKKDLVSLINSGQTSGQIVMATSDLEPAITEADTTGARAQAEKYLSAAPITVTLPAGEAGFESSSWEASRAEIGRWINFSENDQQLTASFSPSAFVNWIGEQVEIPAKDKEVEDSTGTVLNEGQDGRQADTDQLAAQIKDTLNAGSPASFALVTSVVPRGQTIIYPHAQPGRYAGRYIDINLSEQTLYAFEGSTLVNQFLISSGKRGYETPTGEFNVYSKSRANLMSGPDYYLPNVPWISRFAPGPISVHGTYWHSNFGTPMSHGCINASIPDAEWVYNFTDIGTPVYVHY